MFLLFIMETDFIFQLIGYLLVINNKVLICWGRSTSNNNTLPTSYTNTNYKIIVGECADLNYYVRASNTTTKTTSTFYWYIQANTIFILDDYWILIMEW